MYGYNFHSLTNNLKPRAIKFTRCYNRAKSLHENESEENCESLGPYFSVLEILNFIDVRGVFFCKFLVF